MTDFIKAAKELDQPEILERLLFPRREFSGEAGSKNGMVLTIHVAEGISIGCRFYPAKKDGPTILFFHGNGEITADYDYVAPLYQNRGINLFVADYRGYGISGGSPTCSALIGDSHPIFEGFLSFLDNHKYEGDLFVMGRSLGSAPAIEVACQYQDQLNGLIVESGFAGQTNQLIRLGVSHLFEDPFTVIGFGNDIKIAHVHIPTLIIHGEKDQLIPVSEGQSLLALSGSSEKMALFVPGAGHNDLLESEPDQYMDGILSFIYKAHKPKA
jgi:alpha-beta hydrolase superfamily lysophospholipase